MPRFTVFVDDHFNYQREEARSTYGAFKTLEEAESVCRAIVDRSLAQMRRSGMSREELFDLYNMFGDDPFIVAEEGRPPVAFPSWEYAKAASARTAALSGAG